MKKENIIEKNEEKTSEDEKEIKDINIDKEDIKENEENTSDKDEREDSGEEYKKLQRNISWFIL